MVLMSLWINGQRVKHGIIVCMIAAITFFILYRWYYITPILDVARDLSAQEMDGLWAAVKVIKTDKDNINIEYSLSFTKTRQFHFKSILMICIIYYDADGRQIGDERPAWVVLPDSFRYCRVDYATVRIQMSCPQTAAALSVRLEQTEFVTKPMRIGRNR